MPYKRRKNDVDDSKEQEKKSYIIGYVRRASVSQLKRLHRYYPLDEGKEPSNNFFALQERLLKFVKDAANTKAINRIYDVLPPSY